MDKRPRRTLYVAMRNAGVAVTLIAIMMFIGSSDLRLEHDQSQPEPESAIKGTQFDLLQQQQKYPSSSMAGHLRELQGTKTKTKGPKTKGPKTKGPKTKAPKTKGPKVPNRHFRDLQGKKTKTKGPKTKAPKTKAPKTKGPKVPKRHFRYLQGKKTKTKGPKTKGPKTKGPKTKGPKVPKRHFRELQGKKTKGPKTKGPKTKGPKTKGPKTKRNVRELHEPEGWNQEVAAIEQQDDVMQQDDDMHVQHDDDVLGTQIGQLQKEYRRWIARFPQQPIE